MTDFDYKYYLETYSDLRHLNYQEAYSHFQNFGMKEGRSATAINTETNVTIILHLFNTNLFDEMKKYIYDVKRVFSIVNILITINSYFAKTIRKEFPEAIIIIVKNKGVDVYPFLVCLQHIRMNNIKTDFILKLHTKESSNNTEDLFNWREDLIKPIVNYNNLVVIQHYFKTMPDIGYVGSQKCVMPKNYDLDFSQNIKGINELCDKFPHLEKEWTDFIGGNMFWISNECLTEYLTDDLIEYLNSNFTVGKPPSNLSDKGIYVEYLCERMFSGLFCYNKQNILVNEYTGTQRGISTTNGKIDHTYFYQPRTFSISIPRNVVT